MVSCLLKITKKWYQFETKYYRNKYVIPSTILKAAQTVPNHNGIPVLITSSIVSNNDIKHIKEQTGVIVWDRNNLFEQSKKSLNLLQELEIALLQPGDFEPIFNSEYLDLI